MLASHAGVGFNLLMNSSSQLKWWFIEGSPDNNMCSCCIGSADSSNIWNGCKLPAFLETIWMPENLNRPMSAVGCIPIWFSKAVLRQSIGRATWNETLTQKATGTIQDFESWIKKITGDIKGKHQVHFSIEAQLRFLNLLARTWRPTPSLMVNISVNIPNYTIRSGDSSLQDQAASEGNWAVFPANSTSISEGHARRCTFSRSLPIHYPLAHMYYSARYAFPARLWGQIYWLRHFDSIYLLKATV